MSIISEINVRPTEWMVQGLCSDTSLNPEWWFPETKCDAEKTAKIALDICSECPVKRECLEFALKNWPQHGIWGGLRNKQLQQLAKGIRENNERSNND